MRTKYIKGTTLPELLVYITVLGGILLVVTMSIVQLGKSFRRARVERSVALTAETVLERIAREIRLADSVECLVESGDCMSSNSQGKILRIESYPNFNQDHNPLAEHVTKEINLSGSSIMFTPNTDFPAAVLKLISSNVSLVSGSFTQIYPVQTPRSIRIQLKLSGGTGATQITRTYYTTATLGGSMH